MSKINDNRQSSGADGSNAVKKPHKRSGTAITVVVVLVLLGGFLTATLVSQIFKSVYKPLKCETALFYQNTESVLFQGVYIRKEQQEISQGFADRAAQGTVAYTNKNGSKLSINTVVAIIYSSNDEIYLKREIEFLQKQIDTLLEASLFSSSDNNGNAIQDNSQIGVFSDQLSDVHLSLFRSIDNGDFEQLAEYKNEYLGLQSKIGAIKGNDASYGERIGALQSQLDELKSRLNYQSETLWEQKLEQSGYFVSNADGYEDILNYDYAAELTREQIKDIVANPVLETDRDTVGKIIDDYKWRMAAVVKTESIRTVTQNSLVRLILGTRSAPVEATVINIADQGDGETVIVFECELLDEEFVKKRVTSVRLLLDTYEGIRVPQSAVRYDDKGERGVYIKIGAELSFRKINILRTEKNFVIVEIIPPVGNEDPEYLQIFDEVVVDGKKLYDGKIVS